MMERRRQLLKWLATGIGLTAVSAVAGSAVKRLDSKKWNVVIVGGGFAGATCARTLKRLDPGINVTLIEKSSDYFCGPLSAEYLAGKRSLNTVSFDYNRLKSEGINMVYERAVRIDSIKKCVETERSIHFYDRCVVAVGINFEHHQIKGYNAAVAEVFPHAWQGQAQAELLKQQLHDMRDGGTVLMTAPNTEYRCPPGPYERVSLIAEYLKENKPRSKIIFLDSKDRFPKQAQFELAWSKLYGYGTEKSIISWVGAKQGGAVTEVDIDNRELICAAGRYKGDVINIIPFQKASSFAFENGLTDQQGWCPVNTQTFESLIRSDIHVIGDAADARNLPKSAFAACCQARVCALGLFAMANDKPLLAPQYMNVCFSVCGTEYAISVVVDYRHNPQSNRIETLSTRLTPLDSPEHQYVSEVQSAYAMFDSMVKGAFG